MLMGGQAKIGKTFLLMDLAHQLAVGGNLWGIPEFSIPSKATPLFVENEIGIDETQRRFINRYTALNEPAPENAFIASKIPDMLLDMAAGAKTLRAMIDKTGANVVILDPISRFMLGSENDNSQVQVLIRQLDEIMRDYPGLSIVLSHHFGKPPAEKFQAEDYDPLSAYNFRGASKWFDAPDTIVTFQSLVTHSGEWKRMRTGFELRRAQSPENKTLAVLEGGIVKEVPASFGSTDPLAKVVAWGRKKS